MIVAENAGAIDNDQRKLSAAPGWDDLDPLERCRVLFGSVRELGPGRRIIGRYRVPFFEAMDELLAVGVLHLVTGAFVNGEVTYEEMLERAVKIVEGELAPMFPQWAGGNLTFLVDNGLSRCIDSLERCGVAKRLDVEMVPDEVFRREWRSGGRVVMGDLGRLLMEPVLPMLGYRSRELADLSDCSALDAARVLGGTPDAVGGNVRQVRQWGRHLAA